MCERLRYKVTAQSKHNIKTSTFESGITSTDISCFFTVSVHANTALKESKEKSNCTSMKIRLDYFLLPRIYVCMYVCARVCVHVRVCTVSVVGVMKEGVFHSLTISNISSLWYTGYLKELPATLPFPIAMHFPPLEAICDNSGFFTLRSKRMIQLWKDVNIETVATQG